MVCKTLNNKYKKKNELSMKEQKEYFLCFYNFEHTNKKQGMESEFKILNSVIVLECRLE